MAPPKTVERPKQLHILLTEEEHADLQRLAKAFEMTVSDYVRWHLNFGLEKDKGDVDNRDKDHIGAVGAYRTARLKSMDAGLAERAALSAMKRTK